MKNLIAIALAGSVLVANGKNASSQVSAPEMKIMLLDERYEEVLQVDTNAGITDSILDQFFYYRGKAFERLFNYDSAYHCYRQAGEFDSSNVAYRISEGQMLTKLGRIREAIDVYESISGDFTPSKQQLTELAALYSLRNEHGKSLGIYLDLLENDSLNYYFAKQAGKSLLALGNLDSSIYYYEYAFDLNPADVFLTHQLTNLHLKKKDIPTSLARVNRGIIFDSTNLDLLMLRGYVLLLTGDYEGAIADLEKARMQDTSSVFIEKYLGLSYHDKKDFDLARQTLLRAWKLDSTDAEIAYFLGNACRWSKFEEDGVTYFLKSIELMQPHPGELKNVYIQLAELYKVLHEFDKALAVYDDIVEIDPSDNTIYFKIAQIYDHNLLEKRTAIEYYEMYLFGGPTDQMLFKASEGTSDPLEQHVRNRIDKLKEDLFFEE